MDRIGSSMMSPEGFAISPRIPRAADLGPASPGTGVGHHPHRVKALPVLLEGRHQHSGQILVGLTPHLDDPVVPLFLGNVSLEILALDRLDLAVGIVDHSDLFFRDYDIVDPMVAPNQCRILETRDP